MNPYCPGVATSVSIKTLEFTKDKLFILDQRLLPFKEKYLECKDARAVARAIKEMAVRGAPAIGVAAACGVALGASRIKAKNSADFFAGFERVCKLLAETRPTAVNLFWAIDRMRKVAEQHGDKSSEAIVNLLKEEAASILREDIEANRKLGQLAQAYIPDGARVLTHCNAGALACAGYGTALGVIRAAAEAGKSISVVATETRPRMQGARLTCWEMIKDGFPVTLISDTMVGYVMKNKEVDLVLVGADRIARNGDVANKIGTYQLAILASVHGLPFYVAAPLSTLDLALKNGAEIPIEHRDSKEVTHFSGRRSAAEGVEVINPAFDVTPNTYISAIFTERGVAEPPFEESLRALVHSFPA